MKTITFYSYKGGVGRSLALANMASRLADFQMSVCLLDFDLEAPGLQFKFDGFMKEYDHKIGDGLVDYIYEFAKNGIVSDSIKNYAYSWFTGPNLSMTIIPAGNPDSPEYWRKLSGINWHELLYENEYGLDMLLDLKEKIRRELNPDFLLIDSRTGVSEISGIALSLLADEVVVMAANNRENIAGVKKILKSIADPKKMIFDKPLPVNFVLSRIPFTGSSDDIQKEQNLIKSIKLELGNLVDDICVIHSDRDLEEKEQLKIGYEGEESVSQICKDYLTIFDKVMVKHLKPGIIDRYKEIKRSETLYRKAILETDSELKLKLLDDAIEINKYNTDFYFAKAQVYEKKKDWNKAIAVCNEVIDFDSSNNDAKELKNRYLINNGNADEAIHNLEYLSGLKQNNISLKLLLAAGYFRNKEYQKSLSLLNSIIETNPLETSALVLRAEIYRLENNAEAATNDIYRALELQIDNAMAYLVMARINVDLNNIQEFYLNFEHALQLADKSGLDIEEEIKNDAFYRKFKNDDRFIKILDRYRIFPEN